MFEARKARLEELREKFDGEFGARSSQARLAAEDYLRELDDFLREFRDSPVFDPTIARVDTTGTVKRAEEYMEWVMTEQRRVRRALTDLA